jgi:hypothetical protein
MLKIKRRMIVYIYIYNECGKSGNARKKKVEYRGGMVVGRERRKKR